MSGNEVQVVLVHGAWADGSSWSKVVTGLRSKGIKAVTVPLPLTTLADDAAAVARTLERVDGPDALAGAFAQNAAGEEQVVLAAVQRPIATACIGVPLGRSLWQDVPAWYLVAEQDRMIVPDTQRFMAERMNARVSAHPVDHTPSVTAPAAVVDLILQAAL